MRREQLPFSPLPMQPLPAHVILRHYETRHEPQQFHCSPATRRRTMLGRAGLGQAERIETLGYPRIASHPANGALGSYQVVELAVQYKVPTQTIMPRCCCGGGRGGQGRRREWSARGTPGPTGEPGAARRPRPSCCSTANSTRRSRLHAALLLPTSILLWAIASAPLPKPSPPSSELLKKNAPGNRPTPPSTNKLRQDEERDLPATTRRRRTPGGAEGRPRPPASSLRSPTCLGVSTAGRRDRDYFQALPGSCVDLAPELVSFLAAAARHPRLAGVSPCRDASAS